jgi:hypothetical protein
VRRPLPTCWPRRSRRSTAAREDFLESRDFADMIALIDGREELPGELQGSEPELRAYLANELTRLSTHARFSEGVSGHFERTSQARPVLRPSCSPA